MWLLWSLAAVCELIQWCVGITLKLNYFNVKMLTMHRWFNIDAAEKDLNYQPIVGFREGWADTLVWFRQHWLPTFDTAAGMVGLAEQSQAKIDTQAEGELGK